MTKSLGAAVAAAFLCLGVLAKGPPESDANLKSDATGELVAVFGPPVAFATHAERVSYGFSFGPSDGSIGAIPVGAGTYTFYGSAGSSATCTGAPKINGTFPFTGTLDHVSGISGGCRGPFGPANPPTGFLFVTDDASGGRA